DVRVEVRGPPAADRGDEVGEVIAAARAAPPRPPDLRQRGRPVRAAREELRARDGPAFQVVDVADALPAVRAGAQAPHLKNQLRLAVVEQGDLRVGRLAAVGVAET